ncbi:hypothetical protein D3C73_1335470 [compost metagenome]
MLAFMLHAPLDQLALGAGDFRAQRPQVPFPPCAQQGHAQQQQHDDGGPGLRGAALGEIKLAHLQAGHDRAPNMAWGKPSQRACDGKDRSAGAKVDVQLHSGTMG